MQMQIIYLIVAMSFSALYTVAGRCYNICNTYRQNAGKLFNVAAPAFASLFWLLIWFTDFSFDPRVLPYSVGYGITYCIFTVGMIGALTNGTTSVTALVKQLALVGVSFWGFAFWQTPFTPLTGAGIVLIVVSLCLCLLNKHDKQEKSTLAKWAFYAVLITVGNAGCSIIQRYQQMAFACLHKNMFMFFSTLFATGICLFLARKENKTDWGAIWKRTWIFPMLAGASSAFSNVFILLLVAENVSAAVIYPGVAVGGLMITSLVSFFCFRERQRPLQWLGLAIGAVALALLNL